jgi:phosphoribosylformylglycinamidine synthase
MKAAVIAFPGSNRDRDMIAALTKISGHEPAVVWHKDTALPDVDLVVIPGGFSYGDYLRSGAIAARSPIMDEVRAHVARGGYALGVCNGFQILTEAGLLPGVLMRNASLRFVCREVAHHDGNYFTDDETFKHIEGNGQVAFRYAESTNPNGSLNDIAGVFNEKKTVLGLMPHP